MFCTAKMYLTLYVSSKNSSACLERDLSQSFIRVALHLLLMPFLVPKSAQIITEEEETSSSPDTSVQNDTINHSKKNFFGNVGRLQKIKSATASSIHFAHVRLFHALLLFKYIGCNYTKSNCFF